jgi:hypothetical protein
MEQQLTRFQEQVALLLGAGTLAALAFGKRRPFWGGIVLFGMGGAMVRSGLGWLESQRPRQTPASRPESRFDLVTEESEESFPASDPPSWVLGVESKETAARVS